MEDEERISDAVEDKTAEGLTRPNGAKFKKEQGSSSSTPNGSKDRSRSSTMSPDEVKPGSDSASTPDPSYTSNAPKLSRKVSQKPVKRAPPTFDHLPDVTMESCTHFQMINDCLYGSKHMGSSEHETLDCDCSEEWRKSPLQPPHFDDSRSLEPFEQMTAKTTRVARTLIASIA